MLATSPTDRAKPEDVIIELQRILKPVSPLPAAVQQ